MFAQPRKGRVKAASPRGQEAPNTLSVAPTETRPKFARFGRPLATTASTARESPTSRPSPPKVYEATPGGDSLGHLAGRAKEAPLHPSATADHEQGATGSGHLARPRIFFEGSGRLRTQPGVHNQGPGPASGSVSGKVRNVLPGKIPGFGRFKSSFFADGVAGERSSTTAKPSASDPVAVEHGQVGIDQVAGAETSVTNCGGDVELGGDEASEPLTDTALAGEAKSLDGIASSNPDPRR